MMKRCWIYLAAIMALTVLLALPVSAEQFSGNCGENVNWVLDDETGVLTITGEGEMVIPTSDNWSDHREKVSTIIITDGITSIGHGAFSLFLNLTSVQIPDSVTKIARSAFNTCRSLTEITLPDSITEIGQFAFCNCSQLKSIALPPIEVISNGMFSDCTALENVIIPSTVKEIQPNAFSSCHSLTEIILPDSLERLYAAFMSCSKLKKVTFGSRVTLLSGTFDRCTSLTEMVLPDSVESIDSETFRDCTALAYVYLGSGVKEIGDTAFAGCTSLREFTLSQHNPHFMVDRGVLYSKDGKKMVRMPSGFQGEYTIRTGTQYIAERACYEISGLTKITIPGSIKTIEDYTFFGCKNLVSVDLSNGLERIELYAFAMSGLEKITLPPSVSYIDSLAFSSCRVLREITFTGNFPTFKDNKLYVKDVTGYYPANNPTWSHPYSISPGDITWVPVQMQTPAPSPAPDPTVPGGNTQAPPVTEPEETLPEESATEPSSEATEPTETTDATDATQDSDPTDPEPTGSQQPTQTPPADNGSAVPQLNTTDKIVIAIGLVAVALLPGVVSFLVVSKLRGRSRR